MELKSAKQILNEKYAEVGAYNMSDIHRIEAMEKFARQAFEESRLTHPMLGFKHRTFDEFLEETLKK